MENVTSRRFIFVYGTLMRGSCRHHVLTQQEYLGDASTQKRYRLYNLGTYPGLVDSTKHGFSIQGELYSVNARCLKELDKIEAVEAELYERKRVLLRPPWEKINAEAYFYLGDLRTCTNIGSRWSVHLE